MNDEDFLKTFDILTRNHNKWEVWCDFIYLSASSISNSFAKNDYSNREREYLRVINKYDKKEQELFVKLFAKLIITLESNPEQDYLGKIFTRLGLTNGDKGQFFTPYDLCKLMAKMNISKNHIQKAIFENGYYSINDPTCGAGATLIASASVIKEMFKNSKKLFPKRILFTGQDIDMTVGLMCYLQLSILGCSGFIKIGNSLTDPIRDDDDIKKYWFTPTYFLGVWRNK